MIDLPELLVGDELDRVRRAPDHAAALALAVATFSETLPTGRPLGFVGCGSSLDVAEALANAAGGGACAVSASEFEDRDERTWIGVTRSGRTAELLEAMRSKVIRHAITCDPDSPVGKRSAHVLDLSIAADSGHVAAGSTIVTAAAIASLLGASSLSKLSAMLRNVTEDTEIDLGGPRAPVVWLAPWSGYALCRELVRKSVETGRRSSYAHTFEFLHGDDLMYQRDATWVLLESPERAERFVELANTRIDPSVKLMVVPVAHGDARDVLAVLARAFVGLFAGDLFPKHA